MCLQFDLFLGKDRQCPVPIVFQYDIIDNQYSVQFDGYPVTNHLNVEGIPFPPQLIIRHSKGFARIVLIVV